VFCSMRLSRPERVCSFGTEPCFFFDSSTKTRLVDYLNRFTGRELPRAKVTSEVSVSRKGGVVVQSLAGSSTGGADTGVELPRPQAELMSLGVSWPRPRGGRPSRLLGPDSRRRPWRRWPRCGADVVLQSGGPPTASPSEARSDPAEGVVDAEGAAAPFGCRRPSLQDQVVL
jgi:hypothetical protein